MFSRSTTAGDPSSQNSARKAVGSAVRPSEIDTPGLDEAVAWAARVPDAKYTEVEVRPVLDMSGWEF